MFYVTMFVLNAKIMQHLGVNFGVIWRLELFLYLGFFLSPEIRADFQKSSGTMHSDLI